MSKVITISNVELNNIWRSEGVPEWLLLPDVSNCVVLSQQEIDYLNSKIQPKYTTYITQQEIDHFASGEGF